MTQEVRSIKFVDEHGAKDVKLPPWDTFSKKAQEDLAALDTNRDGTIVYSVVKGVAAGRHQPEVGHDDHTANELNRILFSYSRVTHHDHRKKDSVSVAARNKGFSEFKKSVFKNVIVEL